MKNTLFYTLIFLAAFASETQADNFNLISYYPAPSGAYSIIQFTPRPAISPDTNCEIGTIYANSSVSSLPYYCAAGATTSKFQSPPGIWLLDASNFLYPADTPTRTPAELVNEKVGIGTTTPIFKLTLNNDGGILADTTNITFTTLPNLGAGTRLVWYPKKKAFRTGNVDGTQWDDANIGSYSTAMGANNTASGTGSSIFGGLGNTVSNNGISTIAGGKNNTNFGGYSVIVGGENNTLGIPASIFSYVWAGGYNNSVTACGTGAAFCGIAGGANNIINTNYPQNSIVGGSSNSIVLTTANRVMASAIGGGSQNINNGFENVILGGRENSLASTNVVSGTVIGGGYLNSAPGVVGRSILNSVIGGGYSNTIIAGTDTLIAAPLVIGTAMGTIAGGSTNSVSAVAATVSGGLNNSATRIYSTVSGGQSNTISGNGSSILGGKSNTITGAYSTILGGESNSTAGDYSLVVGKNMALSAAADRTFLWGYSAAALPSPITTPDAFIIYSGRMGIRDITPAALLEMNANASTTDNYLALTSTVAAASGDKLIVKNNGASPVTIGVGVTAPTYPLQFAVGAYVDSGGNFMSASSRAYKENISELSLPQAKEALSGLNPVRYNYKNKKGEEYVGFISEDVPALVVDQEREGLAPMDIIAVLTKVVQNQQKTLKEQKEESKELAHEFAELDKRMKAKGIR